MKSVNSGMTNRVLTDILNADYGIEAPSNSTKTDILKLLEEAGCPVTPDLNADKEKVSGREKPKFYLIKIFKTKEEKGAVTGCINGKSFVLPRGVEVRVSEAIYTNLTQYAIKMIGDPIEGGGMEMYNEAAYPLTLVRMVD